MLRRISCRHELNEFCGHLLCINTPSCRASGILKIRNRDPFEVDRFVSVCALQCIYGEASLSAGF